MGRLIHLRENQPVLVPSEIVDDTSLSYEAKGLYVEILGKPFDGEINPSDFIRGDFNEIRAERALRELLDAGYLI